MHVVAGTDMAVEGFWIVAQEISVQSQIIEQQPNIQYTKKDEVSVMRYNASYHNYCSTAFLEMAGNMDNNWKKQCNFLTEMYTIHSWFI